MNALGATLAGAMMYGAETLKDTEDLENLQKVLDKKTSHIENGAAGWFQALLSGILGNWLVGLAAFFASKGRTLPGKFVGILIPVTAFVTLGVQHSPANMGYFALGLVNPKIDVTFVDAYFWTIVPSAIGNMIGAFVFVAAPLWYLYLHRDSDDKV